MIKSRRDFLRSLSIVAVPRERSFDCLWKKFRQPTRQKPPGRGNRDGPIGLDSNENVYGPSALVAHGHNRRDR
jgi:hypothetical protein